MAITVNRRVSLEKRGPFPFEMRDALAAYAPPVRSVTLADYVALHTPIRCRYQSATIGHRLIEPGETLTLTEWRGRQSQRTRAQLDATRRALGLPNIAA